MSRYRGRDEPDSKVYVGDLGSTASKQDIEEAFRHYGPLKNVWVARHPPGFAFVEFEDVRDAEDAVRGLDGRSICGRRVRVEPSNAGGRRRNGGGGGGRGPPQRRGRPYHPDDKCYQCGERGHYARDCNRYDRRGRSRRTRSSTRSRSRSRDRRSRSRGAGGGGGGRARAGRSRSKSESRSRSGSRAKRSKTPDRPSRGRDSKSYSRSRSGSPDKKGKSNGVAD